MNRDESVYLQHILDAINWIEDYLTDITEEIFHQQHLVQDGVIRQLEIIGEAVKNLSPELREVNPHIPWQDIAGTRDKLIHNYFGVDIEKVWLMTQDDIPPLKLDIIDILQKTDSAEETDGQI
ncbi:MAG: hypothetical protein ACI8V2_004898 [Candidatus Latescibacterota bacterium]|jgi:uncharacterized protein with HEPN domain